MGKFNTFQVVIIGISLLVAGLAVLVFALQKAETSDPPPELSVWGYMSKDDWETIVQPIEEAPEPLFKFNYSQISGESLGSSLVSALAYGRAPDLLIYPDTILYEHRGDLLSIPYESYSDRAFRDAFIEAGEVFRTPGGIIAFPIAVDPLIMYWNRTLLSSHGYAKPPEYWDEIPAFVENVSRKNGINIQTSAIALGTFSNIKYAKDILSAMLLQTGDTIVEWRGNSLFPTFADRDSDNERKVETTFRYFTEFVNPVNVVYTWNSVLPEDRSMFIAGDLALFLGASSEAQVLQRANPNLNFDTAPVPQIRGDVRTTSAHVIGIAVQSRSYMRSEAQQAASLLSSREFGVSFAQVLGLAPAHRDALSNGGEDASLGTAYRSALFAKSWPDANPSGTYEVLKGLVQTIVTGRLRMTDAIREAQTALESIIR